jgi:hypothetical protein
MALPTHLGDIWKQLLNQRWSGRASPFFSLSVSLRVKTDGEVRFMQSYDTASLWDLRTSHLHSILWIQTGPCLAKMDSLPQEPELGDVP